MNKEQHALWIADNGDATKRIDYNLTPDSIVIDAGGYKGDWADKINEKYGCHIFIYEPVKDFYLNIKRRFHGNDKIHVFNYGLGSYGRHEMISLNDDSASIFGDGEQEVFITDIKIELMDRMIEKVDLIKINIEGGEYELLERMSEAGMLSMVDNIQVQFHDFVPNAELRRNGIIDDLKRTHNCDWCYTFVWENWSRK